MLFGHDDGQGFVDAFLDGAVVERHLVLGSEGRIQDGLACDAMKRFVDEFEVGHDFFFS